MTLQERLQAFPLRLIATALGQIAYRRAGAGGAGGAGQAPIVLLHGIGSASGSWVLQLEALQAGHDVLAWDAPGYGASDPVAPERPQACDYAERLLAWLDALGVNGPVTLVGHSLGALMAASAACLTQQKGRAPRVARLVLLAPAQGYARARQEQRESKLNDRLALLNRLGPQGMAQSRGKAMLSAQASVEMAEFSTALMAGIDPAGYTQASHMLAGGDLRADLEHARCPALVASGSEDSVTPAESCRALAAAVGADYLTLGAVGHACALEAGALVNALLLHPEPGAP